MIVQYVDSIDHIALNVKHNVATQQAVKNAVTIVIKFALVNLNLALKKIANGAKINTRLCVLKISRNVLIVLNDVKKILRKIQMQKTLAKIQTKQLRRYEILEVDTKP